MYVPKPENYRSEEGFAFITTSPPSENIKAHQFFPLFWICISKQRKIRGQNI